MAKPKKQAQVKKEVEKKPSGKVDKNAKAVKAASKKSPVKKSEIAKPDKVPAKAKAGNGKAASKEQVKAKAVSPSAKAKKAPIAVGKVPTAKEIRESNKKLLAASKPIQAAQATNKNRPRASL
jgi:hypothetical protein